MKSIASSLIPETLVPGGWIVGGKTRLLDVWTASNIVYWAPIFQYNAHELVFTLQGGLCKPSIKMLGRRGKLRQALQRERDPKKVGGSEILFDTRHDTNSNVAHILQNQIGVALTALDFLGIKDRYQDLKFLIHSDAPDFAVRLYAALELKTIANSHDSFEGTCLRMQPQQFPLLSIASRALREHAQSLGILDVNAPKMGSIFLARRDRRGIENTHDIERLLAEKDFRTVYAEDLALDEQIRTIAQAERIFAIHGAALGYQLFRNPDFYGVVMECFPSAFITNWSRGMCLQGGDIWIGCQGNLSVKVMRNILGTAHPHDLEAENFRVDPSAVASVIRMADRALAEGPDMNPHELISEIAPIVVATGE